MYRTTKHDCNLPPQRSGYPRLLPHSCPQVPEHSHPQGRTPQVEPSLNLYTPCTLPMKDGQELFSSLLSSHLKISLPTCQPQTHTAGILPSLLASISSSLAHSVSLNSSITLRPMIHLALRPRSPSGSCK